MVCAYLSVCLLVYIGGWHRLLHPSAVIGKTPDSAGVAYETVRFDPDASGKTQLTGWWIPVPAGSENAPTLLYLHDGDGALAWTQPDLALLHLGSVNIFAIDYRGYGQSAGPHPTQTQMQEDAGIALDYLLYTRHLSPRKIVPAGVGLGGVLAARLAAAHPELPAVLIDQPRPEAYYQAVDAQQSRLLPMHLLVRDRFDLAAALADVRQPKLLIVNSALSADQGSVPANTRLFRAAPSPKTMVTFDRTPASAEFLAALHRFLDESVR